MALTECPALVSICLLGSEKHVKRRALLTIVVGLVVTGQPALAVDGPQLLGGSNQPRTTSILHSVQPANNSLSEEATQLATAMGIMPKIARIQQMRGAATTGAAVPGGSDGKITGYASVNAESPEYMALKQDVLESLVMAGFEVRTVAGRIDHELANAGEVLAYLAERRDRAVRLNTYADFISGGITGIISGGLKLADAGGITADLLDTIEGGLQTSLASWAFQQQRGEAKREKGIPSILAHLFATKGEAAPDYPPAVWAYLSSPLPASKTNQCRLDLLVNRWRSLGYCFTHKGHRRNDQRMQHVAEQAQKLRVTIDVLEDRVAMLNDLRATVVQMDSDLLELTQTLHGQRTVKIAGSNRENVE